VCRERESESEREREENRVSLLREKRVARMSHGCVTQLLIHVTKVEDFLREKRARVSLELIIKLL
jgi:hypothetical protein